MAISLNVLDSGDGNVSADGVEGRVVITMFAKKYGSVANLSVEKAEALAEEILAICQDIRDGEAHV